mgnify:CR=1 FL=1
MAAALTSRRPSSCRLPHRRRLPRQLRLALYFVLVPMGVAQALLTPSLHKLIASWAPVNERTRVHNTICKAFSDWSLLP